MLSYPSISLQEFENFNSNWEWYQDAEISYNKTRLDPMRVSSNIDQILRII